MSPSLIERDRPGLRLPLRFDEQLTMDGYTYSCGIATVDPDGDGDLDVTSADALPNNDSYWFENDGQGLVTRTAICEAARFQPLSITWTVTE